MQFVVADLWIASQKKESAGKGYAGGKTDQHEKCIDLSICTKNEITVLYQLFYYKPFRA